MKRNKLLLSVLVFLISISSEAQERPPIAIYSPEIYGAETQNWSISQSKDKYIYVANNKGLLEFNGARWQLYPSPNETIMRSVKVVNDKIYTGCYREFGYWKKNNLGTLIYTSLSQKLKISFLEDEEFWNIITLDNFILFQSLKRIYIYNKIDETYTIIESDTKIYKIFKVSGSIYYQKTKSGIYKIENGESKLISNNPIFKDKLLVNIFSNDDILLIETEDDGFYTLNKNDVVKEWNIQANIILSNVSVYRSIKLRDDSFILGTISDGILHLTPNGEIQDDINFTDGLSNNTVLSVFEDIENNIWLGLDNGINCINNDSPFSVYNDKDGKLGTVYATAVINNNLYLGTNQGLFYKPLNKYENFKFIEKTQGQVWCLVELGNTLFCGHNSGTFVINNNKVELINDIQGTWNIKKIKDHEDRLLQGNYDGLYVIEKQNGNWHLKNKIAGFDTSSRFFEVYGNNEIFVNHENKGVFNIKVDEEFTKVLSVSLDSSIQKGLNSSLLTYQDKLLYADKKGVFQYDLLNKNFQRDSILSNVFKNDEFISGKLVSDKKDDKLWSFSQKNISYVSSGKLSNLPKIYNIAVPKSLQKGKIGYENVYHLVDKKYLLGTTSGYVIIDLKKQYNKDYKIIINSITSNGVNETPETVNKTFVGNFKNKENNLEFFFNVPEFNKYLDAEYQYQLEGIYDQWSDWSISPKALFTNLPYGDYTFNVRAKVGNNVTNNVASYSFNIERPWLLSDIMISVYTLAILLFSLIIHNIYKRYYTKQREKLLEKTTKELELEKLENQRQLMRFNNEKLRQDIENKNRELGMSTLNLIKKNEFLHNIKKDLKNTDDLKNLKYVIKIIDRNLNNTDDWQLFEEAFNNADKDFLKKIKIEHPSLTHNDLRLCAYLRLNLSSKEIAPLLNISPRSVEVKRYRLRKKLGLPHKSSLSDYILEI